MSKFGLKVPDFIQIFILCKEKIFLSYEKAKKLLQANDALRYAKQRETERKRENSLIIIYLFYAIVAIT
jgi:hypothetical protein